MQTSKWGPSGWKLLHSIAQSYNPKYHSYYPKFYKSLANVLPCKYCRISYTEYYSQLPLTDDINTKQKLQKWMYDVHNKVNLKLRNQGLLFKDDPAFTHVYNRYSKLLSTMDELPGWDFLYSITHNYNSSLHDKQDFVDFFTYLGYVLLKPKYRILYQSYIEKNPIENYLSCSDHLDKWLYNLNYQFNNNIPKFDILIRKYDKFKADCSKKRNLPDTCRLPDFKNRCKSTTKRGRQCSRRSVKNNKCKQHMS